MKLIRQHPRWLIAGALALGVAVPSWAQQRLRKPQRAEAPKLTNSDASVFFTDVKSVLQGELPKEKAVLMANTPGASASSDKAGADTSSNDPYGWSKIITPATIEDAVKASKLRLDQILVSAPKFKGGGNTQARKEFSLQAMLFAIIEQYPGDVRWKKSAPLARERFVKIANNAKTNTDPVFAEAKQRLQDLNDLIGGSALDGSPSGEVAWGEIIDRGPLMELLEWCQQEHLLPNSSSAANFEQNKEDLQRYAELVAALGKMTTMKDMPDAADAEYVKLANQMVEQAGQMVIAVKTNSPDLARQAAGQIGQCCSKCHDGYR